MTRWKNCYHKILQIRVRWHLSLVSSHQVLSLHAPVVLGTKNTPLLNHTVYSKEVGFAKKKKDIQNTVEICCRIEIV